MTERKYLFSWDLIGDLKAGRPNLGPTTRLEVYRLMQFTLRDVLEQRLGTDGADEVFREAGRLAGRAFREHVLCGLSGPEEFLKRLQTSLKEMGMGILRMEEADPDGGKFVLTVAEDLDCSGLPETGHEVCVYDEGFLAGVLESFFGREYTVREIECWCTGDRTCRFRAEARTS